ncbi:hypothetical protein DRN84_03360 [Candidatus Geothermarchaeota archaeon]|nr:MAG: hypothetical protein DRN84_03360 [Candidatus Geothermarchaeota archaeon]
MLEKEREVLEALRRIGVWSWRKRRELAGILLHRNPAHLHRVYLGGFLLYALHLSVEEATAFIERYCEWVDFDRRITERNLRGIHKRGSIISWRCSTVSRDSVSDSVSVTKLEWEMEVERLGSGVWVGRCCANGYCLEWHRVYLFG